MDLLELLGVGYLSDCIMSVIQSDEQDELYHSYMADCVYYLCMSMGVTINKRYIHIIHSELNVNSTDEHDDETVAQRLERFGIKVVS